MAEQGFITPEVVIQVLVTCLGEGKVKQLGDNKVLVVTDDDPRVYQLGTVVTRRMVLAIANRHKVPSHLFWHPEMLVAGDGGQH
jgi:hypothetical protein